MELITVHFPDGTTDTWGKYSLNERYLYDFNYKFNFDTGLYHQAERICKDKSFLDKKGYFQIDEISTDKLDVWVEWVNE